MKSVRVQITDPVTGDLTQRVPATECVVCGDVVLGAAGVDGRGRCMCCVRAARARVGRPSRSRTTGAVSSTAMAKG